MRTDTECFKKTHQEVNHGRFRKAGSLSHRNDAYPLGKQLQRQGFLSSTLVPFPLDAGILISGLLLVADHAIYTGAS